MRGYAALAVVFFHLGNNIGDELSLWLPNFVLRVFAHGFLGVPVFFVISGFAISASVGDAVISGRYFGNFILRRSIRLDPPYWASIVVGLILLWMKNRHLGADEAMPSLASLVAHVFYLQVILGFPAEISEVYWTLAQEVQLYLFYVSFVWLMQRMSSRNRNATPHLVIGGLLLVGIYSLLCEYRLIPRQPIEGLFFPYWHYFLIGILSHRMMANKPGALCYFLLWMTIEVGIQSLRPYRPHTLAGISSGVFLFAAIQGNMLDTWLTGPISQYLGRISYSLYLLHADLGWKVISLGKSRLDASIPLHSTLIFLAGILVSILAAQLLYMFVEKPASNYSKQLRKEWPRWGQTVQTS